MKDIPDIVQDTNRTQYALGRLLGRGGQGAVYAVCGRDLAVKLSNVQNPEARGRIRENIARIKRLPLDGLNVARPLRALAPPQAGYVMELMTGMEAIGTITRVPRAHTADFAQWYLDSGGLLRRLRLLARCAALMRDLHARGLAYGDASPGNIFVSRDHSSFEVWLIDCDNIVHGTARRVIYTPGYAAPELFGRYQGSDSLTDAWSLATIVFEALCVLHPFCGDLVHDGEPELEERAWRGELPWVDDEEDDTNFASRGLPRPMVLTPSLQKLAVECFGASRKERLRRPTAGAWAEKLHKAADQVIVCPECTSSYYLNMKLCPWCNAPRPRFVIATVYLRDPSLTDQTRNPHSLVCRSAGRPQAIERAVIQPGRQAALTDRHLYGTRLQTAQALAELDADQLVLQGTQSCTHVLQHRRSGEILPLAGRTERIDLGRGKTRWWLAPQQPEGLHRVVTFELH